MPPPLAGGPARPRPRAIVWTPPVLAPAKVAARRERTWRFARCKTRVGMSSKRSSDAYRAASWVFVITNGLGSLHYPGEVAAVKPWKLVVPVLLVLAGAFGALYLSQLSPIGFVVQHEQR